MPEKKSKERLGIATLASVKKEMAQPRRAKSTREADLKPYAAWFARKAAEH